MRNKLVATFIVYAFFTTVVFSQHKRITDPVKSFISKIDFNPLVNQKIYKLNNDFNNDGLQDIALSCSDNWGNAGGKWLFYFQNKGGSFTYYDKIDLMSTSAYTILKENEKTPVLLVYNRYNCCSGILAYYSFAKKGFKLSNKKEVGNEKSTDVNQVSNLLNAAFAKGEKGVYYSADLRCLRNKKNDCWTKE